VGSRERVAYLAPLNMATLGVWRAILSTYMFVCIWMSVSMAVIMFNKWLLAFYGFPYPLTLTMWHMIFCSTIALVPSPPPTFKSSQLDPHNLTLSLQLIHSAALHLIDRGSQLEPALVHEGAH
jgi:hypothetical protein